MNRSSAQFTTGIGIGFDDAEDDDIQVFDDVLRSAFMHEARHIMNRLDLFTAALQELRFSKARKLAKLKIPPLTKRHPFCFRVINFCD